MANPNQSVALDFSKGAQRHLIPAPPSTDAHLFMSTALPWRPGQPIVLTREDIELPFAGASFGESELSPGKRVVTNVAWSCHSGAVGFEWGYGGSGPHELALNILNQFVPPGADGCAPREFGEHPNWVSRSKELLVSRTASFLFADFAREVIAKVPHEGGTIDSKVIESWIRERIPEASARYGSMVDRHDEAKLNAAVSDPWIEYRRLTGAQLERRIEADPDNGWLKLQAGFKALEEGRLEAGKTWLLAAMEADAGLKNAETFKPILRTCEKLGAYEEMRKLALEATRVDEGGFDCEIPMLLGAACLKLNLHKEALAAYVHALERSPSGSAIHSAITDLFYSGKTDLVGPRGPSRLLEDVPFNFDIRSGESSCRLRHFSDPDGATVFLATQGGADHPRITMINHAESLALAIRNEYGTEISDFILVLHSENPLSGGIDLSLSRVTFSERANPPRAASDLDANFSSIKASDLEKLTGYRIYWNISDVSAWYPTRGQET